jgi:UDP-N-acetylmuramoyl-L-alanyl-D-glutamate--2,6-diaminopimelate ligase
MRPSPLLRTTPFQRTDEGADVGRPAAGACARISAADVAERVERLRLSELLEDVDHHVAVATDTVVTGVAYDSREVVAGDAFFCVSGFRFDGHDFARDAVDRGAVALVVGHEVPSVASAVPQAVVEDPRAALAVASATIYDHPSRSMDLVGVTGTNGKTTTTYLLDSILKACGRTTGLLGTVEVRVASEPRPAGRTTPESADLQRILAEMVDAGVDVAVMEVSSHAIDLHRVDGVDFAVSAFTNLTHDHLDYHKSLEEYFSVKRRLFTDLTVGRRVVNVDDEYGASLAAELGVRLTVGTSPEALVRAEDIRLWQDRSEFDLVTPDGRTRALIPLAGAYNVSNALVAVGCALALELPLDGIVEGLAGAEQAPGRLERVDEGQEFGVYVDYAHTPDALEKAILAVKSVTPGDVVTVFGCGGDRDPEKRPMMGEAAGRTSDRVIVTTDNPRTEDPVGIILHIEDGLRPTGRSYEVEVDRRSAIERAIASAHPGDSVLIAGKGHEDYQIFAERTIHFDDRETAREVLRSQC